MRVSDIWEELVEATGTCDSAVNYRALTRAVELLATEGLFDPLVGTVDFIVDGGYLIALPRDVKTPLRLNINNNPSFARNRIFEFSPNAPGSVDGPEIGYQWHERSYSPVQDELKLPSKLKYDLVSASDIGKTLTIIGTDTAGRKRTETIIGAQVSHIQSKYAYAEVASVTREATEDETYLVADTGNIARYYPDEEQPEYRVIKLSQTGVAVRMLYRKHVFKLSAQTDIIPLHSAMAVIRAVEAVRLMQRQKHDEAAPILAEAVRMISKEQETRDEGTTLSSTLEVQTVTNTNINTNDVLIVADIYDKASDILGGIGRAKIFDRITDAVEVLQNKTQWDSTTGNADVCRAANMQSYEDRGKRSSYGYFVMPRYVDTVLAVNLGNMPAVPRNAWFEFHLNGPGSRNWMSCNDWQDCGRTPIVNGLPRNGRRVMPVNVMAIPESPLDNGKIVTVYGIERLLNGREIEVYRNGTPGWNCPCQSAGDTLPVDAPDFVRIDRITREASTGFVRFVGFAKEKTVVALVGDVGASNSNAVAVADLINIQNPDHVVLLGDVNYETETPGDVYSVIGIVGSVDGGGNLGIELAEPSPLTINPGDIIRLSNSPFLTPDPSTRVVLTAGGLTGLQITFAVPVDPDITGATVELLIRTSTASAWGDTVQANLTNQYGALKTAGKLDAVPGNHEWGEPYDQPERLVAFKDYFGYTSRNFVKTFGDVDVFFLDSDPRNPDGIDIASVQHAWLLASAAASTALWKVVVMHHPPFTSGTTEAASVDLRWDFAAMGINAVITGHQHNYERYEKDGVIYLVAGTGGKSLYGFTGSPSVNSLKRVQDYGALFMEVSKRALKFTFMNSTAVIMDTRELDADNALTDEILMGYWYPDELEPNYRLIRVTNCCHSLARIRYRKRAHKITSLTDVINLRSRLAIENMIRAIAKQEADPAAAALNEQVAIGYLEEEQMARNPHGSGTLQFEPGMAPGDFMSIN
jgi:hypothetical protein